MPTFSRLCIQQNTNFTSCEKEGYPLLPSKMIFVPSLVVPPKNSHQPWPFRCLASDPNPSSTIQLHCTLSKQLFKRFREFRHLCRHLSGAIKAGTNHRAHKITYLREVISTTISLFLRLCVDSDAVDDAYYKKFRESFGGCLDFQSTLTCAVCLLYNTFVGDARVNSLPSKQQSPIDNISYHYQYDATFWSE